MRALEHHVVPIGLDESGQVALHQPGRGQLAPAQQCGGRLEGELTVGGRLAGRPGRFPGHGFEQGVQHVVFRGRLRRSGFPGRVGVEYGEQCHVLAVGPEQAGHRVGEEPTE